MTIKELKQELTRFPEHYEVALYEHAQTGVTGLAILNTEGRATTAEDIIPIEPL